MLSRQNGKREDWEMRSQAPVQPQPQPQPPNWPVQGPHEGAIEQSGQRWPMVRAKQHPGRAEPTAHKDLKPQKKRHQYQGRLSLQERAWCVPDTGTQSDQQDEDPKKACQWTSQRSTGTEAGYTPGTLLN